MFTENKMNYKKETIKGISWVGSFRILSRLIALLKTVVLARVFSPTQFGVFGIAALVFGVYFLTKKENI